MPADKQTGNNRKKTQIKRQENICAASRLWKDKKLDDAISMQTKGRKKQWNQCQMWMFVCMYVCVYVHIFKYYIGLWWNI